MGMQPPAITGQPATAPLAEHKAWSIPGVVILVIGLVALCAGILLVAGALMLSGLVPVVAGEARVVQLFGRYHGTVRNAGLAFVNPFTKRRKVSVRIRNHETAMAKVNDADGNPIEIAAG